MKTPMKPLISVCMPMYNASKYLRECMDSVLSQSFEDFEFLIVDDGSTDDSVSIVESYTDSRIRLIKNKHDYIGSLNMLLKRTRGKYIARMDADDVMMPDRLMLQIAHMEAHTDIDILGGAIMCIGVDGRDGKIVKYKNSPINVGDLLNGAVLAHPAVMIRTTSVSGMEYHPEYVYAEDFHFWCQAIMRGLKIENLDDVLIKYRFYATNSSCTHKEEQKAAALKVKADLEEWVTASEAAHALPTPVALPPSNKELTVIITFLNEGEELENTVAEIRRTVADSVDIIVINDCSFDGYPYAKALEPYGVHYIVNRHRLGVAASRDLGVSICRTPYFLLLDAHMRFYCSRWSNRITEELHRDDRQLLCCQGRFLYKDEKTKAVKEYTNVSTTYGAYSPFNKIQSGRT